MRKILTGILGTALVASLVGGAAFALFSSSATVTNLSIAAGNASLLVGGSSDSTNPTWDTELNLTEMYPGYGVSPSYMTISMFLENDSSSPISLGVKAKLTTLPTGWNNYLTYATQVGIVDNDSGLSTGWLSLPEWTSGEGVALLGAPIAQGTTRKYTVYIRIPYMYGADDPGYTGGTGYQNTDNVGNEIASESLSGAVFTLTGTQI